MLLKMSIKLKIILNITQLNATLYYMLMTDEIAE